MAAQRSEQSYNCPLYQSIWRAVGVGTITTVSGVPKTSLMLLLQLCVGLLIVFVYSYVFHNRRVLPNYNQEIDPNKVHNTLSSVAQTLFRYCTDHRLPGLRLPNTYSKGREHLTAPRSNLPSGPSRM
jgi:hypothetical protein